MYLAQSCIAHCRFLFGFVDFSRAAFSCSPFLIWFLSVVSLIPVTGIRAQPESFTFQLISRNQTSMVEILALDICHVLIGLVQAATSWSAWIDTERGGGDGRASHLNMQEKIIPYPDKPIKPNEIVSFCEPVAMKVDCTWKNIYVNQIPCHLRQTPCVT